jgi:hypothetical protein
MGRAMLAAADGSSGETIVRELVSGLQKPTSSVNQNGAGHDSAHSIGSNSNRPIQRLELPPLEEVNLVTADVDADNISPPARRARTSGGGSASAPRRNGQDVDRDVLIGDRGEELIYRQEVERVKARGVDPDIHVQWTSRRDPGADHDIRSIAEDGKPLWIEVKSTMGTDGKFEWSQNEFKRALAEGDHYELWRVYEVHTERPTAKCFRNPIELLQRSGLTIELGTLRGEVESLE